MFSDDVMFENRSQASQHGCVSFRGPQDGGFSFWLPFKTSKKGVPTPKLFPVCKLSSTVQKRSCWGRWHVSFWWPGARACRIPTLRRQAPLAGGMLIYAARELKPEELASPEKPEKPKTMWVARLPFFGCVRWLVNCFGRLVLFLVRLREAKGKGVARHFGGA